VSVDDDGKLTSDSSQVMRGTTAMPMVIDLGFREEEGWWIHRRTNNTKHGTRFTLLRIPEGKSYVMLV
jgi:hypothetical protein